MKDNKKVSFFGKIGLLLFTVGIFLVIFAQPRLIETDIIHAENESIYLSDLDWADATTGSGDAPNKDKSIGNNVITLTDNNGESTEFEKGVGTNSSSEIIYDVSELDHKYFTTWVGVDREVFNTNASIQYEVYVDNEKKYESKIMEDDTPMEYATVDITGAQTLKLIVNDGGNGTDFDHGDWAGAKLHYTNPVKNNTEDIKKYEGMKLVFNDEFNSDELDNEKWGFTTTPENGTHHYANKVGKSENVWVEDGNLNIQAKEYEGDGDYSSTSAAISTENKFDFRYGRVDVRAKIPSETGMWPAIWMMPDNPDYEWPMAGEIDIMELISDEPNKIWSTLHSGIADIPDYYFTAGDTITKDRGTYYDDYHVYSMEWEPATISFYVDDTLVSEINEWENWVIDSETGDIQERAFPAPFNEKFFLKLNLATGGWSQDIDETTRWGDRTTMKVDYVRVYQEENQISRVTDLRDLVGYHDKAGDFTNDNIVHVLGLHLTALELYEKKGDNDKVFKHLNGFKDFLDHPKEEEEISDEAYHALTSGAEILLEELE